MIRALGKLRDYVLCSLDLGIDTASVAKLFWSQTKNLRVRYGLSRHRPDRIYSIQTTWGRLHFRDNFGDITNLVDLFHHQVYKVDELDPDGVILDIGANIGLAAAYFARLCPSRPIYCFEPLIPNAALIPLNCPTAQVHQVAVGASRGQARLQVDSDSVMASTVLPSWETHEETFEVIPLDEFASSNEIGHVALIKIDAEGMENEILAGATEVLKRTGHIVMETHGRTRHDKALDLLRNSGFRVVRDEYDGETGIILARLRQNSPPSPANAVHMTERPS